MLGSNGDDDCGKRLERTSNSYVEPYESTIWCKHATEVHGLHKNHPLILSADPLHLIWDPFVVYISNIVSIGCVLIG